MKQNKIIFYKDVLSFHIGIAYAEHTCIFFKLILIVSNMLINIISLLSRQNVKLSLRRENFTHFI